jgi:uncharacterized membrane protein
VSETNRIEAFSDGVLAIAITLLVLDLHAPITRGDFLSELGHDWPAYLAYLASFLVIGTLWLTHHALFRRIARVDFTVLCLNLGVLLASSAMPFPTAIVSSAFRVGDRGDERVAMLVFAGLSLVLTVLWQLLTRHVGRTPTLLYRPVDAEVVAREHRQQLIAVIPPLIGIALAFVLPVAALVVQAVTPLLYLSIAGRTMRTPAATTGAAPARR